MTVFNKQGALMERWYKTPNAMVDDITGDLVSTQAAAILGSILRLTGGVLGREWAAIPHSYLMKKTRAKRAETIGKYIKELTDLNLIIVDRKNGKTSRYSIDWSCHLWYGVAKVEVKTSQSVPLRFIRTGTLYPYTPVRLIRSGSMKTSTFHPYTYKEIETKDNIKEKKIAPSKKSTGKNKSKKQPTAKHEREVLVKSLFDKWIELTGQRITATKPRLSHINARLDDGKTADDIIFVMTFVATDPYRVEKGYNKLELAVRSIDQFESMFISATAAAKAKNGQAEAVKPQTDYQPAFNGWNDRNPNYQPPSQIDQPDQNIQPDVYHPSQKEFTPPVTTSQTADNWHWKEPLPGMSIPQTEKHLRANKLRGESATKTYMRLLENMQASTSSEEL